MPAFRRVVGEGMASVIYPALVTQLEDKVSHWKIEVKFLMTKTLNEKGISVKAFPSGKGAKYWRFRSYGTAEHTVRVKKLNTMRHWPFKRYKPALALPGKGVIRGLGPAPFSPGTVAFRHQVVVRAMPGLFFEKQVALEYKDEFRRHMENIVRRGVTAAQREGS